jgi:hypothetical protein
MLWFAVAMNPRGGLNSRGLSGVSLRVLGGVKGVKDEAEHRGRCGAAELAAAPAALPDRWAEAVRWPRRWLTARW